MAKTKVQDQQEVRKIIDVWLVVCPRTGPQYLSNNKEKAIQTFNVLNETGQDPTITKITAHKERVMGIGLHLTNKAFKEAAMNIIRSGNSLLQFRNTCVIKTHEYGDWEKVRSELGLPEMTYEDMNAWLMDFMKYYTKELD